MFKIIFEYFVKMYKNDNPIFNYILFISIFLINFLINLFFDLVYFFYKNSAYDLNFIYNNILVFNYLYISDLFFKNYFLILKMIFNLPDLLGDTYVEKFDKIYFELILKEYEYNMNYNLREKDFYYNKLKSLIIDYRYLTSYMDELLYRRILRCMNLPVFFYFGLLYLFTTIISLITMSYLGLYGVFFINLFSLFMFWLSTFFYMHIFFIDNITFKINLGKWFFISTNFPVFFELLIDSISYSFMLLTLTIALFVYIYAFSYFRYEPNVERLILFINCFVISMVCLVISGNFFVLFLGWELIGLTSFLLINFWSTRISTLKSAFKAFTFNKFSDVSLLIAIILIYFVTNDINIINFNINISSYNNFYINILDYNIPFVEIISFFLIICAFIKSAQFGFHIWLPDSMEAPVPASALIHSATLVSAGVFLLLRFSYLFEYSLYSYYIIPIIGSLTAFFGGICSAYQSDIKKILAYSTISHCGFLMVCYSTYIAEYTILYLYIHGFFKASVFLCVGNIIRFSKNYQDFRRMGKLWKYLPFECFFTFICLINLCGLPFSIGFYIKHLLLIGYDFNNFFSYFIYINILFGAISGLFYSYRLFYNVFFDFKKSKKILYNLSNRENLNSFYYSNTSLISNIAIISLVFLSYLISIYLFDLFLNSTTLGDGLNIFFLNSSQYYEFNKPLLSLINNVSYFNWILLLLILLIITISWRCNFLYFNVISFYFLIINVIIFTSFFYNYI